MSRLKKARQILIDLGLFAGAILVVFIIWQLLTPRPNQAPKTVTSTSSADKVIKSKPKPKKTLQLVAIGDSLTHGVGDETNKEGYVSWTFPDNLIECLRVSKRVFAYPPKGEDTDTRKLKLIPMTPTEWKEEYIMVDEMF